MHARARQQIGFTSHQDVTSVEINPLCAQMVTVQRLDFAGVRGAVRGRLGKRGQFDVAPGTHPQEARWILHGKT